MSSTNLGIRCKAMKILIILLYRYSHMPNSVGVTDSDIKCTVNRACILYW